VERKPIGVQSGITGEEGFEQTELVRTANAPEIGKHLGISRRQMVVLLQTRFGYEGELNIMPLARLINVEEKEIRRFISRRGMRTEEFLPLQSKIEDLLDVSAGFVEMYPGEQGIFDRRAALADLNQRVAQRHGINPLKGNRTDLLVSEMEKTLEFHRQQLHDVSFQD
jgi:hypothetical protein